MRRLRTGWSELVVLPVPTMGRSLSITESCRQNTPYGISSRRTCSGSLGELPISTFSVLLSFRYRKE